MLHYIKLGGSVITEKSGREQADLAQINGLAQTIGSARADDPSLRLLIGHGSGSFGHFYAARYGVHLGLAEDADWRGFALTGAAASRLSRIVHDQLLEAGLPVLQIQPSAALSANNGQIDEWHTETIAAALVRDLIPLIHGDVAFDAVRGSAIISTEMLFAYLAKQPDLSPARIILVGEDAVYTSDPRHDPMAEPIAEITRANIGSVLHGASGSHGVDVTGGMRSKIESMWQLIERHPRLEVVLVGPNALGAALRNEPLPIGTIIRN